MRRRQFLAWGFGAAACLSGCGTADAFGALPRVSVVAGGGAWTLPAQTLARLLGHGGVDIAGPGAYPGPGTITRLTVTGLSALSGEISEGGRLFLDGTPLARLIGDTEVLVVPTASTLSGFEDFAAVLLTDPGSVRLVGGPQGETDHLLFALIAQGLGADTRQLVYEDYAGPAEACTALLAGQGDVAAGPLSAWRAAIDTGRVRALAVSCADRLPGLDAPALLESGVRIDFADWCAVLGPPKMRAIDRTAAVDLIGAVVGSRAWQRACDGGGWRPLPLVGDDFTLWLGSEISRTKEALGGLGLLDTSCWGTCGKRH